MGRRPHPLIAEYFIRGAKLNDHSNRYEYTCSRCGQRFPKGRMESLLPHLTRKCPALNTAEKTRIVLRLNDLDTPSANDTDTSSMANVMATSNIDDAIGHSSSPQTPSRTLNHGGQVQLPFSPTKQQDLSALNVLAEASRQVGGNGQPVVGYTTADDAGGHHTTLDPQLDVDFPHTFLSGHDDGVGHRGNTTFPTSAGQNMPSMHPFMSSDPSGSHEDFIGLPLDHDLPVSSHPADLSNIAASANETLENVMMGGDLELHDEDDGSSALLDGLPANLFHPGSSTYGWSGDSRSMPLEIGVVNTPAIGPGPSATPEGHASQHLRPIAINPASQSSAMMDAGPKSQKPKIRGRFTAERRKEVQGVRKLGACIRCRMLKKVCSKEDPCTTCASVENPRVWGSCVRTKLAEELLLFSVGTFSAINFHDVNSAKARIAFSDFQGKIEMYHFTGGDSIWLKGLQGRSLNETSLIQDDFILSVSVSNVFILDEEEETFLMKVERYLHSIRSDLIKLETSPVIQAAVRALADIGAVKPDKKDDLTTRVCNLWTATNIIIGTHESMKIRVDIDETQGVAQLVTLPMDDQGHYVVDESSSPYAHNMIMDQLRAAFEKRAGVLCRSATNEFERRLLQRSQSTNFEIFLVSFVLLNCAERMSWLFNTWADPSRRARWPLDKGPDEYADMGEKFAKITHMLLGLRQLEPKVAYHPETGEVVPKQDDAILGDWLHGLPVNDFIAHSHDAQFQFDDSRSLDGTFCARLLRPDDMTTKS